MDFSVHFDIESFEVLRDVMGDEFNDLLRVFIDDTEKRFPLLHRALNQHDTIELRELAHSFKGASGNVSAATLSALCLQLETAALNNNLSESKVLLTQIEQEYQQVRILLNSMI